MDCQGGERGLHRSTRSRFVEKFRSFHARLRPVIVLFVMLNLCAEMSAAPKSAVLPAPPQPMAQKVTVKRGGSVEIALKIYGTRAQTLSWIIREQPVGGKLSAIRATAAEAAAVTYRPPADVRVVSDHFTFSVRSSEGVSAPVEVTITITDDPPQIGAPVELDFGVILTNASAARTLEFSNSGGGIAEGTIEVGAPWKVEGGRRYKLQAGEKLVTKIGFAPERAGKFESEVKFTSQPDRAVILRGVAEDALAVNPVELLLAQDAGRPLRAASFKIRNNTEGALDVTIAASARLILKTPIHLGANEVAAVPVQTAETDVAVMDETIVLNAGALTTRLPVKAKAVPGLVRASPERVIFRMGAGTERIVFANQGGMDSKVTLAIDPPFAVEEAGFVLAPGMEKAVAISLPSASGGGAQAALKVGVDGGGFEIPVASVGITQAGSPPVVKRAKTVIPVTAKKVEAEISDPPTLEIGDSPATVESVVANSATFRWTGTSPKVADFRLFRRILSLDEAGELVSTFEPYPAFKIVQRGSSSVATVDNLLPGEVYTFRVDAVVAGETQTVTFAQIHTPEASSRKSRFSLVHVLFALMLVTGGLSIWQRVRTKSGF